jgi:hypothetical protein
MKLAILDIKNEMPNAIIFNAECLDTEKPYIVEITKDVLSDYFNGNCPRNEVAVQWLKDERFQDFLIDAADWIVRNQLAECTAREAVAVGYRLFRKAGGFHSVCASAIKNIECFMKKESNYYKFETIFN